MARAYYEAIEPVAESFGDLDPAIDARDGDTEPGVEWTGFHVAGEHLWVGTTSANDAALADKLDADIKKLADLVKTVELQPLEIANGAKELLDEVATSKVTGEEDRYSRTDLWDFAATSTASRPPSTRCARRCRADATLLADARHQVHRGGGLLDTHKGGDGYKLYPTLTPAETKALADSISALAERSAGSRRRSPAGRPPPRPSPRARSRSPTSR